MKNQKVSDGDANPENSLVKIRESLNS